jgi:hypothetical protein
MVRKLGIQQLLTQRREERPPTQMPKVPSLEDNYPAVVAASKILTKTHNINLLIIVDL